MRLHTGQLAAMSRQSLTAPNLICVPVQLLPSATAFADCFVFSSVVQRNNTPTDLYITLLSLSHTYHTQTLLPSGIGMAALKDAFKQPGEGGGSGAHYHFQLHEDKAAAAVAGHSSADALLYVRKDRRNGRVLLTIPLPRGDSHLSNQLLQHLQKLFQRLQESVSQHEADSAERAAAIQHNLAALQQRVQAKRAMEADMAQCTLLLLKEKRAELARCEDEFRAALAARQQARRDKAKRDKDEGRRGTSQALDDADVETDSDRQTTSEEEDEVESELSRPHDAPDGDEEDAVVMEVDDSDNQRQARPRDEDVAESTAAAQPPTALSERMSSDAARKHASVRTQNLGQARSASTVPPSACSL